MWSPIRGLRQCGQILSLTKWNFRRRCQSTSVSSTQRGKDQEPRAPGMPGPHDHGGRVDGPFTRNMNRESTTRSSDQHAENVGATRTQLLKKEMFTTLASMGDYANLEAELNQIISNAPSELAPFHFNSLIYAYFLHDMLNEALETFERMKRKRVIPSSRTFNLLLRSLPPNSAACSLASSLVFLILFRAGRIEW